MGFDCTCRIRSSLWRLGGKRKGAERKTCRLRSHGTGRPRFLRIHNGGICVHQQYRRRWSSRSADCYWNWLSRSCVLIRGTGGIEGATTAATIWIVAAIGMAIGAGYVAGGIGLALLTRGVLSFAGRWEQTHFGAKNLSTIGLVFDPTTARQRSKSNNCSRNSTLPTLSLAGAMPLMAVSAG